MVVLGQALQVLLIKIPDLKKRAKIANQLFIWKDWWSSDSNLVWGTFAFGAMVIIGFDEVTHYKPEILHAVKWFFAGIGAFGSNFVMAKWSKYGKYFDDVTDEKTNIADGIKNKNN